MGVSHIDTAELYAEGHAETLVGKAIRKYDRSKLFIASKVEGEHFAYNAVITACENSLRRLDIPYLDLYMLHWYEEKPPLAETIKALDELMKRGLVRNIGVSNFNVPHLKEAQSYMKNKIVSNQVHYNLIFREPERKGLVEYCKKNDVMLIAWRPVEKGKLGDEKIPVMREMAKKYKKTPAQIAINWLISQQNVVTISKSRLPEHLKENLGAVGWNMETDDIERLREEFPGQQDISDAVQLE